MSRHPQPEGFARWCEDLLDNIGSWHLLMWEIHIRGRDSLMDAWVSDCRGDPDDEKVLGECPASGRPFGKGSRDHVLDMGKVLYRNDGKVNIEWKRLDNNLPSIDRIICAFNDFTDGEEVAYKYGRFNVQLVHWQVRSSGRSTRCLWGTDRGRFITGEPDQGAFRSAERRGDRVLQAPARGRGRHRRQDHQRPVNFAW